MSKVRKITSIVLAVLMVAVFTLTGCNKAGDTASTNTESTKQQTASQEGKSELPPVNLVYYYAGFVGNDDAEVFARANEIVKKEINATIDFRPIVIADYNKKMTLTIASGEECDLSQSGGARQPYALNITKGAYLEMDSLLDKYGEWFKANIPAKIFDALKFQGKTYAVPNYQISYVQRGLMFQTEVLEKYSIDVSNIKKATDLIPIYEKVKAGEKDLTILAEPINITDTFTWSNEEYLDAEVISSGVASVVFPVAIDNDLKAINMLKHPKILEQYKLSREFNVKGFYPSDILTNNNLYAVKKTGKVFSGFTGTIKPGGQAQEEINFGDKKLSIMPVSNERMPTSTIQATITAINKASKDPDRSMMFLNLLNSNKELNNTLFFGIEDKHYKKVAENRIERIDKPAYESYQWCIGSQFNAYLLPGQEDDVWEVTKKKNESAQPTAAFGFTFNPDNIKTEIANVSSIVAQYGKILTFGAAEDVEKMLQEYTAKCEEAGIQKIIDEMQKQLDEFKANKK